MKTAGEEVMKTAYRERDMKQMYICIYTYIYTYIYTPVYTYMGSRDSDPGLQTPSPNLPTKIISQ